MNNLTNGRLEQLSAENAETELALKRAARTALLEHAHMGRSVCESRDGQIVWITPAEIFARYGLDEHGQPKA